MTMSAPKEHEEKTHVAKCLFFLPFFFVLFLCSFVTLNIKM